MKKLLFIVISIVLAIGLVACSGGTTTPSAERSAPAESTDQPIASESTSDDTASQAADGLLIKVIPLSTASDYWIALKQGAEAAAEEFGSEVGGIEIQFDGPQADGDTTQQIDILNNSVTAGVDGILLAASNPTALLAPVQDAIAQGVFVVTVDSGVEPNDANSFLATDNYAGTYSLGEYMGNLIGGEGKYAIVADSLAFTSGRERPTGFDDGMSSVSDQLVSVGMQLTYSDIAEAEKVTLNYLTSNPDLSVVFASNDRTAVGATNAFVKEGIAGEVKLCQVDVSLDTITNMRDGVIQAAMLQKPYNMGYEGVQTIIALTKGEEVEKTVDTGVFILTPENLDTEEAIAAIRQYIPDYDPEQTK